MNIWILGRNGFVGRNIAQALRAAGHTVVDRPRVDFARATHPDDWKEHLVGVDGLVNAVGVLRDTRKRPLWPTHAGAPKALFDACAAAGVRRVVQISALGVAHSATQYAQSKLAADTHLLAKARALPQGAVVLRPSVVVGMGGASSAMFAQMAKLPVVPMLSQMAAGVVQPLAVADLAEAVAACLGSDQHQGVFNLAGPEVFSLKDLVAHWRAAQGKGPAFVVPLPAFVGRWSARAGDFLPFSPWFSESLELLASPNTSDSGDLARLLGRVPCSVIQGPVSNV
jgi:uncharacterized protein YbjT (DUF2867 family)